ncbi:MAG: hypothetical protein NTV38_02770, partial [Chloroflexi bacterium]|nr:hypothetical protein [Chloroflexota bacterium]
LDAVFMLALPSRRTPGQVWRRAELEVHQTGRMSDQGTRQVCPPSCQDDERETEGNGQPMMPVFCICPFWQCAEGRGFRRLEVDAFWRTRTSAVAEAPHSATPVPVSFGRAYLQEIPKEPG